MSCNTCKWLFHDELFIYILLKIEEQIVGGRPKNIIYRSICKSCGPHLKLSWFSHPFPSKPMPIPCPAFLFSTLSSAAPSIELSSLTPSLSFHLLPFCLGFFFKPYIFILPISFSPMTTPLYMWCQVELGQLLGKKSWSWQPKPPYLARMPSLYLFILGMASPTISLLIFFYIMVWPVRKWPCYLCNV